MLRIEDFVFACSNDPEGGSLFTITPRDLWESEQCVSDMSEAIPFVEKFGFSEVMESTYEFNGLAEEGVKILKALGATDITEEFEAIYGSLFE